MGGSEHTEPGWFAEGARQFVEVASDHLKEVRPKPRNRRAKHLLAMPVVGTRAGGAAERKGEVLTPLLARIEDAARRCDVDVVLVAYNDEMFTAAQSVRRRNRDLWGELHPKHVCRAAELGRRAIAGELVLFLGAGISAPAGLPLWQELLDELARQVHLTEQEIVELRRLHILDQARLLKAKFKKVGRDLGAEVAQLASARRYALAHSLLAGLPSTEVVTVNYDQLFEHASRDAGRSPSVLPYDDVIPGERWVLKLHGSVDKPDDIVLTRSDYLRYADRRAALAGIVQALLITRHMLFVGFSLTDDNFNRIAEEVRQAIRRDEDRAEPPLGTALLLHESPMMVELWKEDLRAVALAPPSDTVEPAAARLLEIFLDCLLAHATSNAPHLLDPTFVALLTDEEKKLKRLLEDVRDRAPEALHESSLWRPVADLLARFGQRDPRQR